MQNEKDPYEQILSPRRPVDWSLWKNEKRIKLWEAVALACDIEPSNHTLMDTQRLDGVFSILPRQFDDLLSMAKNAISSSSILKPIQICFEEFKETEVTPSNFGAWLKSIHYPLPAEFPWQDDPALPLTRNWPWGTYETDLLRKLAFAAKRFWQNYDPKDPSTAPTNNDVTDWLISEHDVARRTAEVMATILRADRLPSGPRK